MPSENFAAQRLLAVVRELRTQREKCSIGPWGAFGMTLYAGNRNVAFAKEVAQFRTVNEHGQARTFDLDFCVAAHERLPVLLQALEMFLTSGGFCNVDGHDPSCVCSSEDRLLALCKKEPA